ncbi:Putative PD-(D/E)XK family member [Granulicatella balaenopterae]|uniref:Putative PD-(D/E)XK family member n=1 Tax=Granulicatella balaenopterae TaxID=137733 RepID=A0A1H9N6M8_9LACT|nr:PD-(D/E)XK motif protein [Granulicatella balaenopterae]SER31329.1 Putative PD-(D/E)XK family member [Granulicatella balaenopterae]
MNVLKKRFEKMNDKNGYQLYNPKYSFKMYIGYAEGNMSLFIIADEKPKKVKDSKIINIKSSQIKNQYGLEFLLTNKRYEKMFILFCDDMIKILEKATPKNAISLALARWNVWKLMFSGKQSNIMSKEVIKGLIGELLFLKQFILEVGESEALESWMGPIDGHKDFEINNTWCEVKAISEAAQEVKISSLEQLESNDKGYLEVIRLEKTNELVADTVTLNQLVIEIQDMFKLETSEELLFTKLVTLGYEYDINYDAFCYKYIGKQTYCVNDEFPVIHKNDLPQGIGKVQYTLELVSLDKFKEEENGCFRV